MTFPTGFVSAKELEQLGILKKSTAYKMLAAGKLPHYRIGVAGDGVRFLVAEVLQALRGEVQS